MDNEFLLMDRIQKIQQVIGKYGEDQFFLSFSGGADSTILHYMLDEALPGNRIPRVFINTGIEYMLIVKFVKKLAEKDDRFELLKPKTPIRQMLETEGYPFKSKDHSQRVDEYQSRGYQHTKTTYNYANRLEHYDGRYGCPQKLQYQFSPDFDLRISKMCCDRLKKDMGVEYLERTGKTWTITGVMADEGGARTSTHCIVFKKHGNKFNPLFPVTKEFTNWYREIRNIRLCDLYYPPYNLERTGCVGCCYNVYLQRDLDMMAMLLPRERERAERIWAKPYAEMRRIGYRLRKNDGQMRLTDMFNLNEKEDENG